MTLQTESKCVPLPRQPKPDKHGESRPFWSLPKPGKASTYAEDSSGNSLLRPVADSAGIGSCDEGLKLLYLGPLQRH